MPVLNGIQFIFILNYTKYGSSIFSTIIPHVLVFENVCFPSHASLSHPSRCHTPIPVTTNPSTHLSTAPHTLPRHHTPIPVTPIPVATHPSPSAHIHPRRHTPIPVPTHPSTHPSPSPHTHPRQHTQSRLYAPNPVTTHPSPSSHTHPRPHTPIHTPIPVDTHPSPSLYAKASRWPASSAVYLISARFNMAPRPAGTPSLINGGG